jgi:pimeloyl-ACP methyl ester carboxylesterase
MPQRNHDVFVRRSGSGTPVVLVHGSLATGSEEWAAQEPLAEAGFRLLVPDRRGYGDSPPADGEDFERDADDIAELLGDGAHLVGHSYGGLGAMRAAALRPHATLSLALLEPAAFSLAQRDRSAHALTHGVRSMWSADLPDREWALGFLRAVGTDPATLPPDLLEHIAPLVPMLRRGRPPWEAEVPLAELASAPFPMLVVSGGHHPGFEAICDELAASTGASRRVVKGAGHEIQFTGEPINETLLELWRSPTPTDSIPSR